jgi:hypothetical protein
MRWSELIQDNEDLGRELFRREANKDAELLRDALAKESPPSPVEEAIDEAQRSQTPRRWPADDEDDDFHLGPLPDMDDASSIFGRAVGLRSDLSDHGWHESPEVDLLGNQQADHDDRTDELRRPSVDSQRMRRDKEALLGSAE